MSHHPVPPPEDLSTVLLPDEIELVFLDCAFVFVAALIVMDAVALLLVQAVRS